MKKKDQAIQALKTRVDEARKLLLQAQKTITSLASDLELERGARADAEQRADEAVDMAKKAEEKATADIAAAVSREQGHKRRTVQAEKVSTYLYQAIIPPPLADGKSPEPPSKKLADAVRSACTCDDHGIVSLKG